MVVSAGGYTCQLVSVVDTEIACIWPRGERMNGSAEKIGQGTLNVTVNVNGQLTGFNMVYEGESTRSLSDRCRWSVLPAHRPKSLHRYGSTTRLSPDFIVFSNIEISLWNDIEIYFTEPISHDVLFDGAVLGKSTLKVTGLIGSGHHNFTATDSISVSVDGSGIQRVGPSRRDENDRRRAWSCGPRRWD